jgi:Ca2+/Na+ antiporter
VAAAALIISVGNKHIYKEIRDNKSSKDTRLSFKWGASPKKREQLAKGLIMLITIQIGIFILLMSILGFMMKKLGKSFVFLALTLLMLSIVYLIYTNRSSLTDTLFLTILCFSIVPLSFLINRAIKVTRNKE